MTLVALPGALNLSGKAGNLCSVLVTLKALSGRTLREPPMMPPIKQLMQCHPCQLQYRNKKTTRPNNKQEITDLAPYNVPSFIGKLCGIETPSSLNQGPSATGPRKLRMGGAYRTN